MSLELATSRSHAAKSLFTADLGAVRKPYILPFRVVAQNQPHAFQSIEHPVQHRRVINDILLATSGSAIQGETPKRVDQIWLLRHRSGCERHSSFSSPASYLAPRVVNIWMHSRSDATSPIKQGSHVIIATSRRRGRTRAAGRGASQLAGHDCSIALQHWVATSAVPSYLEPREVSC